MKKTQSDAQIYKNCLAGAIAGAFIGLVVSIGVIVLIIIIANIISGGSTLGAESFAAVTKSSSLLGVSAGTVVGIRNVLKKNKNNKDLKKEDE